MKAKLLLFSYLCLIEGVSFLQWLERYLLTCPFKAGTGVDCPGCGIQRSFLALMRGDLFASLKLFPATIPIFMLIIYTAIHLKFDFKNGAFFIKILYIAIALIIVINYTYKIFTNQLI